MKKIIAIAVFGLVALGASAEKADAGKRAVIDYGTLLVDEVAQVTIVTGNIVVTKGTLVLRAEKAVIKTSPEEDMQVTLTGVPGKMATFRQKRDGGPELWVEGNAQRIEYDERSGVVKLFGSAHIRQIEGSTMTDEIKSEFISYDSMREVFTARNDASGASKPGEGRGQLIIAPRKPRAAPAPTAPTAPTGPTGTPAPTGMP
ncbi:lipopolysaccharide transport periplasmic protein LptA [Massilia sp. TWP1-3-3]|uniref:lipopolysaccharide transport periplasmic protein LptA n=1 Tax=Massilia sp. TWP1-3-3 TaxID=2804573 RepID=UPI003CE6B349